MDRSTPERIFPPTWRVVAAFVLVPSFAACLVAFALPLFYAGTNPGESLWGIAVGVALVFAYPIAIILGLPTYFILRKHFDPKLVNCSVAGAVVAALPWLFISLLSSRPDQQSIDGRLTVISGSRTAFGWFIEARHLGEIALFGALLGALFWLIAAAGSGTRKVRF